MFCRPRKSNRPSSLWETVGSLRDYDVDCRLLLVKSINSCSEVCVRVGGVKSQPFIVSVGLRHTVDVCFHRHLFIVYMNWIDSHSWVDVGQRCSGAETRRNGVPTPFSGFALKWVWSCLKLKLFWVRSHTFFMSTTSLTRVPLLEAAGKCWLFANDLVLLTWSEWELPQILYQYSAAYDQVGMKICTTKILALCLCKKPGHCNLKSSGNKISAGRDVHGFGLVSTSDGRQNRKIDRRIGKAKTVQREVYRSVVTKRELSNTANLTVFTSIFVPILNYGHEYWAMTERTLSKVPAAKMRFLRRVPARRLATKRGVVTFGNSWNSSHFSVYRT